MGKVETFAETHHGLHAEIRKHLWELYAQDSFRWKPNLTVTYGVRYSRFNQPTDASGHATGFDAAIFDKTKAPQINSRNGQIVAGTGTALNGIIVGGQSSPFGDEVARHDTKD